jgi:hypothetical protein
LLLVGLLERKYIGNVEYLFYSVCLHTVPHSHGNLHAPILFLDARHILAEDLL